MFQAARATSSDEIQAAEAQAVAEIIDRDERQVALSAAKSARRRWRPSASWVAAIVLGTLAIGLWLVDPPWMRPPRATPPRASTWRGAGASRCS